MDLKTLLYKTSQPIADIYIGKKKIYLFALTSGDMSSIGQLNNEDNLVENFKSLFRIIASHRKPNKSNSKRTVISDDFINSLTETELNKVAETYLETPYVKNINEKLKNPLQKNSDEEDIQYLYRLLTMYVKDYSDKNKEMISKTLDPFRNVREASSILSKKIDTYDFSSHAVEQARTINAQRMQELEMARVTAEMTKESTNLLSELAKAVADFLDRWHIQTENNNKTTNIQLWIAAISLALSAALSCAALYYSYKSYKQDMTNNETNNKTQQEVINLLSEGNKSASTLVQQNVNLEHHISELIENQKTLEKRLQDKSKEPLSSVKSP